MPRVGQGSRAHFSPDSRGALVGGSRDSKASPAFRGDLHNTLLTWMDGEGEVESKQAAPSPSQASHLYSDPSFGLNFPAGIPLQTCGWRESRGSQPHWALCEPEKNPGA